MRRATPILLICVVLLPACGFFGRSKNEFYSLETLPNATAPATSSTARAAGAPIGIDAVELPPGIDRREIVVRGADHKLEVRGTHQWAGPLEDMVTHTLAFDLANRLPEGTMILPGQPRPAGAAIRSLAVTFEDLAAGADGVFVLDARWTVTDPGGPEVTAHERITVPAQSTESPAIVAAMSQALAQLAERIAAKV